jgi:hypothetical protein
MPSVGLHPRLVLVRGAALEAEQQRNPGRDDGQERENDKDGQRLGQ